MSGEPVGPDGLSPRERMVAEIPVDDYIARYEVTDPYTVETLHDFPTLVYLLGRVTEEPQLRDSQFGDSERGVRFLVEGSGMFGHKHPDDAMRWKGMSNHSIVTARGVYYTDRRIRNLSESERKQLEDMGFDFTEFDTLDSELSRDFMFDSHVSRRRWDERRLYVLPQGETDPEGSPGEQAATMFRAEKAPEIFHRLIRVEDHAQHLAQLGPRGHHFPNIIDGILTWTDWTFAQSPMTLDARFEAIRRTRPDISADVLDILESSGRDFERVVNEVLGTDLRQEIIEAAPEDWELQIRRAYVSASGLTIAEAFPMYVAQYPGVEAS